MIRTPRLILEPLTVAHAPAMFSVLSDPLIYTYLDFPPPPSLEHLQRVYATLERGVSPDGTEQWLNWIVVLDGAPIGFVQATVRADETEVAYVLGSAHWGRGYALEAMTAMLAELAGPRFVANVDARNERSIRLLERLGFRRMGAERFERGYTLTRLQRGADEPRLQQLLERCSDYYELHEGWPTPKDAAEFELTFVPEGKSADDFFLLGMAEGSGELAGVAQLLRGWSAADDWWIALLVVAPPLRSAGVGAQLFAQVAQFVRGEGGRSLHLAVSTKNPRGMKFWERVGFADTGRIVSVTARNGHVDEVRILRQEL